MICNWSLEPNCLILIADPVWFGSSVSSDIAVALQAVRKKDAMLDMLSMDWVKTDCDAKSLKALSFSLASPEPLLPPYNEANEAKSSSWSRNCRKGGCLHELTFVTVAKVSTPSVSVRPNGFAPSCGT
jgi:hypothetical protein